MSDGMTDAFRDMVSYHWCPDCKTEFAFSRWHPPHKCEAESPMGKSSNARQPDTGQPEDAGSSPAMPPPSSAIASPAAPVGAPSGAQIAQAWERWFRDLREKFKLRDQVGFADRKYWHGYAAALDDAERFAHTLAASLPPIEGAGVEEAQGPIEDCPECEGSGTAVLTADVAGQAASLKRCPHCKGTGKVRETIRWRNLPAGAAASDQPPVEGAG